MAMVPQDDAQERVSQRVRTAHVRRRPAGLAVTLTALAILFVVFYAFVLKPPPSVTTPALSSASGRFTYTEKQLRDGAPVSTTTSGGFVLSGAGSAAVEAVVDNDGLSFERAGQHRWAYDAASREALHVVAATTGRPSATLVSDGWPPLWQVTGPTPVDFQGDAAIVRTAVDDDDETIGLKTVLYEERRAWRASWRSGSWQTDLIVDQETGLVLWYSLNDTGAESGGIEYQVEDLRLDEPPAAGTFGTTPPADARVETFGSGDPEIVGGLEEAAERIGVALPESTLDPDGYELVAIGVTRVTTAPAVWVAPRASGRVESPSMEELGPNTTILLYAKGLSSYSIEFVAEGRRATPIDPGWADLFGHQPVELQYGLFAGRTAHTWYGQGPTAVVWDDDYLVRVSGGLTRTEAVSILEGLEL